MLANREARRQRCGRFDRRNFLKVGALGAAGLVVAGRLTSRLAAQDLCPAEFDKIRALIKPQADESFYLQIPWMTSLREARQKAAAESKPLVIWTVGGNPLGLS